MQTGKDGCDLVKFSAVFNYLQWAWWHTDCAFGTCWVFGEWKKGRCHMSCPDLCALGKLYPGLTFPLCHLWLTSSSHRPLNKQPFFSPALSVTLSPCRDSHSPRRLLNTSRAQRSYWCGEERVRSHIVEEFLWWCFFGIMNPPMNPKNIIITRILQMSAKHGKSLLFSSSVSSHTSCFLLERVTDWLNTLMILSTDACVASLYAGLFML